MNRTNLSPNPEEYPFLAFDQVLFSHGWSKALVSQNNYFIRYVNLDACPNHEEAYECGHQITVHAPTARAPQGWWTHTDHNAQGINGGGDPVDLDKHLALRKKR